MHPFPFRTSRPTASERRPSRARRTWLPLACLLAATPWLTALTSGAGTPASTLPGYEIIRLGRGHYNRLCLAASVAGTKGLLIIDTGAGVTLLSDSRYKALLSPEDRKLPTGVPATMSVNGTRSPVAMAHDFRLGNVEVGTMPVCLFASGSFFDHRMLYAADSERQYDGLLGENVLRHYNAVVDCGRMALYLNTDPARKRNLGPAFEQAGWTRVPMMNLGGDFTVPCTLNGHHFRVIVDTGAPFTKFDKGLLADAGLHGVDIRMKGGLIGRQPTEDDYLRIASLQVGNYASGTTHVMVNAELNDLIDRQKNVSAGEAVLGLLGGDFLAANGAIIDVGDQCLFLKRAAGSASTSQH